MYLLSYVSSYGVNDITGERYPDDVPKHRTPKQIYDLLSSGYSVEERLDNGIAITLNLSTFLEAYRTDILGYIPSPKVEENVVETEKIKKPKDKLLNNREFK